MSQISISELPISANCLLNLIYRTSPVPWFWSILVGIGFEKKTWMCFNLLLPFRQDFKWSVFRTTWDVHIYLFKMRKENFTVVYISIPLKYCLIFSYWSLQLKLNMCWRRTPCSGMFVLEITISTAKNACELIFTSKWEADV